VQDVESPEFFADSIAPQQTGEIEHVAPQLSVAIGVALAAF